MSRPGTALVTGAAGSHRTRGSRPSPVVVCTEWDEYAAITPAQLRDLLDYPVVVDARNVWDPAALAAAGLQVASIGRQSLEEPAL